MSVHVPVGRVVVPVSAAQVSSGARVHQESSRGCNRNRAIHKEGK